MKIICISGYAQHGKDTAASLLRYLLQGREKRVLITHYGDLLKYICKEFFGWDGNKDTRGRSILQYVGTDVIRQKRPEYWVDFLVGIFEMFGDNWDYVLIPDCRFPNEIELLKKYGFDVTTIRIFRPNFDNGLTDEQKAHPSETAMDGYDFDYTIENPGNLGEFNFILADWMSKNISKEG